MTSPTDITPHGGDPAAMTTQLNRMFYAVEHVANLEGQDLMYVIEMSQDMLSDIISGGLKPLVEYLRRYCDVLDTPADAERLAGEI